MSIWIVSERSEKMSREEEFDDDDDEFFEVIAFLFLVLIPIVLIYGLCFLCYKQKRLAMKQAECRGKIIKIMLKKSDFLFNVLVNI